MNNGFFLVDEETFHYLSSLVDDMSCTPFINKKEERYYFVFCDNNFNLIEICRILEKENILCFKNCNNKINCKVLDFNSDKYYEVGNFIFLGDKEPKDDYWLMEIDAGRFYSFESRGHV